MGGCPRRSYRPRRNQPIPGIRHFTASVIVFVDHQRVLLVHHNKLQHSLYPGGHIEPNEDLAQAARRDVLEETGLHTKVICDPLLTDPAFTTHAQGYCVLGALVTALMRSLGRRLACLVARAMLVWPLLRW